MSQALASALLLVSVLLPPLAEIHPQETQNQEDGEASHAADERISKPNLNKKSHSGATKKICTILSVKSSLRSGLQCLGTEAHPLKCLRRVRIHPNCRIPPNQRG
jgi:hypothetical protein